jgi:lysophospholipase L1-like esterase
MRKVARFLVLPAVLALAFGTQAAEQKKATRSKPRPDPAFAPVKDDPALPRVLLIGDSISIGYTVAVREALSGKVNVHRAPTNCGPTIRGLAEIDRWLGTGRWDVVHFNFGLHDLKKIDGKHQVPLDQYKRNLRELVARLTKTGAKLVWCSTTPVPEKSSPPRANEDVLAYNAAAKKIMEENGIAIDDLYSFAQPQIEKIQIPNNVHFTAGGSKVLAGQVAQSILKALEKPAAK